jgi:hypothetical protein
MVAKACNPSAGETEAGELKVSGQSGLRGEFKVFSTRDNLTNFMEENCLNFVVIIGSSEV